jgi:formylglycine-generating enzyme
MNRIVATLIFVAATCLGASRGVAVVIIDTVPVGNPGNAPDGNSHGSVGYAYRIGTYDVTNAQYVAFLNAKAKNDPLGLYNPNMTATGLSNNDRGGITRSGPPGNYNYALITGRGNLPVSSVTWYDALRFANWLSNGQGSGSTETGAYTLLGGTPTPSNANSITRNPGATWFLPSENEWYKAAYYDPSTGTYFQFPTSSNTPPTATVPPGDSNSANFSDVVNDLTNVGAYSGTKTPYGAFDMAGNIKEWNEAFIIPGVRGVRGGSWNSEFSYISSSSETDAFDATTEAGILGFRVASLPVSTAWTGTNSTNWADSGNWSGGVPGALSGTTNTDTAVFNQNAPNSPLTVDVGRNIQNITFDTASVNSLTIGTTGGQILLLTSGGTIQTTSTVVNAQTVNAPLVLEGDYTFTGNASSSSATLTFGGGITPAATSGVTTLALNGSNFGANTISGVLADNGSGQLAVTKSGTGVWILSGANSYTGSTTVSAGTLKFNITSGTPTISAGATATVASGATLELAGSVSALGAAGGNRTHISNDSTAPGLLVSGIHQVVGGIDGAGSVQVNAGSDVTADHIVQSALVIGGAAGSPALVTIDASDANGNPLAQSSGLALAGSLASNNAFGEIVNPAGLGDGLASGDLGSAASLPSSSPGGAGSSAVPEPSTIALFAIALAGLFINSQRSHRRDNLASFSR